MNSAKHTKVDLDSIIKNAFKATERLCEPKGHDAVTESYVAQQKVYNQTTEFVSEKTKQAHTALYKNYLETLNRVSAELDSANRADSNSHHSEYRSLKLDEPECLNAVWLHELYFANCFCQHSEVFMDSLAFIELQRAFGSFEEWQKHFIATAMACGDGWVVTGYSMYLRQYVTTAIRGHSDSVMLGLYPILVVDMHEHSYRDYLNDKRSYLISQMREINWEIVEERVKRSKKLAEALK